MQKITANQPKMSTSRSRLNVNESGVSPQRKKISQESIRDFKIQIDHEIAKCLDTLDRQGLKFLKETLKTSNIFNSTNLEIDEKCEMEQSIASIKGEVAMFQSQKNQKNRNSQQQSKKSLKKDFLQQNKKAFLKNKEPKKQFQSKYRSNSSARLKPSSVVQLKEESKVQEKIKPVVESRIQKKRQMTQNVSTSRVNQQRQQNVGSRVIKKTVLQNKKTNQKISLGERIGKKMEQLNINKVGPGKGNKSSITKKVEPQQKTLQQDVPAEQAIQEEIIETHQHEIQENVTQSRYESENDSTIKSSIGHYKQYYEPQIKISQKINPLKPSTKEKFNQSQIVLDESKFQQSLPSRDSKSIVEKLSASIQVNHQDLKSQAPLNVQENKKSAQMSLIVQKINKLSPEKLMEIQKYLDFIENKSIQQREQNQNNQENIKILQKNFIQSKQEVNLQKISEAKSIQSFQKIDKIETEGQKQRIKGFQKSPSYNGQSLISSVNKVLPHIPRSDSRKGMRQKKQKASMIYGSNMKSASRSRIKVDLDFEEDDRKREFQKIDLKQFNSKPYLTSRKDVSFEQNALQRALLQSQRPLKMEKIDFKQKASHLTNSAVLKKPSLKLSQTNFETTQKQSKREQINAEPQKQKQNTDAKAKTEQTPKIQQNSNLNIQYTEVKMLNINNKKAQVVKKIEPRTQLKFKILSNRGHQTIFGLTGIELFTIQNKRVLITQKQVTLNSVSTAKLLYLFNGNHYTTKEENIYQSSLSKNEIIVELDKQNQKIGGIMIFNFNKSSLESSKEVEQMEIYHNDQKMWKGIINPGVYNQTTEYATQIQFMPNFSFPKLQKSPNNESLTIKKQKTQIWIDDKKERFTTLIPQVQRIDQNNEKVIHRSENRRANTLNTQKQYINQGITFSQKYPLGGMQCQKVSQAKPKEIIQSKNRVHSVAAEQRPSFQKKQLKTVRQDNYDEFDRMLKGLEQNINRQKSRSKLTPASLSIQDQYISIQNKQQSKKNVENLYQSQNNKKFQKPKVSNNQIDDFMNDSIFNDKPHSRIPTVKRKIEPPKRQQQRQNNVSINSLNKQEDLNKKNKKDINIDDFLGELQDVMKNKDTVAVRKTINKTEMKIEIPNLPQGQMVQMEISQNWGHQAYVGLQTIQFFDEQGRLFSPIQVYCNKNHQNVDLMYSLNSKNMINKDQKIQTKVGFDKNSTTNFTFRFSKQRTFSLIRIWNYNGHRVHSNIGIKQCLIKIDGKEVFLGQFKKNQSTPQNFHKHFKFVLFTNDSKIMKKIKQNDWLTELKMKLKQEKNLFKSTLINFNRPKTKNNDEKSYEKQNNNRLNNQIVKQIKLPKRACWEYEPPETPEGKVLVFLLHDTWGDQNFIGLNGIQIFDTTGTILGKEDIHKLKAFPSNTGEKSDKRVIENVLNGENFTNLDCNIWLSTFQSDIEKLESGKPNTVIIEFYKPIKIAGINFYNYSKTPERGVRQIEIQVDNFTAFRGYLKIFDQSNAQNTVHTTINFTKNIQLLEKMNYEGYNQDSTDQNVAFVNEKRLVKI